MEYRLKFTVVVLFATLRLLRLVSSVGSWKKKKIYLMKETALYMMMQWSVRMQGFVMMLL